MKIRKSIGLLLLLGLICVACGKKEKDVEVGSKENPVKIGVVGENNEIWNFIIEKLAEDNIYVELVTFTNYNEPNEALLSKDINLNSFQHQNFLDNFNKEKNSNLVSIGDTLLAPIALYSNKIKDISELKENDSIAIPDDVTNYSRALTLLETAGLIKLEDKNPPYQVKDIVENKFNLKITPLDATQTARSLDDVTAAVINSGLAIDAGYNPIKDSVFLEPVNENSKPYINIIVSREEEKDNDIYKKIVKAYQSEDTKKKIEEVYKGSSLAAWEI